MTLGLAYCSLVRSTLVFIHLIRQAKVIEDLSNLDTHGIFLYISKAKGTTL